MCFFISNVKFQFPPFLKDSCFLLCARFHVAFVLNLSPSGNRRPGSDGEPSCLRWRSLELHLRLPSLLPLTCLSHGLKFNFFRTQPVLRDVVIVELGTFLAYSACVRVRIICHVVISPVAYITWSPTWLEDWRHRTLGFFHMTIGLALHLQIQISLIVFQNFFILYY